MVLKDFVCTFDTSKKLHENGIKQDSLIYWDIKAHSPMLFATGNPPTENHFPAFTGDELNHLLPDKIPINIPESPFAELEIGKIGNKWIVGYSNPITSDFIAVFEQSTEIEAKARMILWLSEKRLIKN